MRKPSTRSPTPHPAARAQRRQAAFWNARYRGDPTFFGEGASPFLTWLLSELRGREVGSTWVELGSGYGRDLTELRHRGFSVRGVDVSGVGTVLARRAGHEVVREHAVHFLERLTPGSVDVVFSNLFLNMEFTRRDHERLFSEIRRVLAPGGLHAYSVRASSDPWYGRGRRAGPDTFDLAPHGPVLHFFSPAYARELRRGRFRLVRTWEGPEEGAGFPIRVRYVLERRPADHGPARERRGQAGRPTALARSSRTSPINSSRKSLRGGSS